MAEERDTEPDRSTGFIRVMRFLFEGIGHQRLGENFALRFLATFLGVFVGMASYILALFSRQETPLSMYSEFLKADKFIAPVVIATIVVIALSISLLISLSSVKASYVSYFVNGAIQSFVALLLILMVANIF